MPSPEFIAAVSKLDSQINAWLRLAQSQRGFSKSQPSSPVNLDELLNDIVSIGLARIWASGGLEALQSMPQEESAHGIDASARAAEIARSLSNVPTPPNGQAPASVSEVIARGIERGDDLRTTQLDLMKLGFDSERADRIAQTISAFCMGAARVEMWKAAGYARLEWATAGGPCAICNQVAARGPVPIGKPFVRKGEVFALGDGKSWIARRDYFHEPLHPCCRCTTFGVEDVM
jgi:hypothetical protein